MSGNLLYRFLSCSRALQQFLLALPLVLWSAQSHSQAVTQIISDYNGWWKSSSASLSQVQPDNHHNLLAFSYNGITYSTGVNDAALTAHGETFNAGRYQALPLQNVNGTVNSNTKIGLGALADGVSNGAGPAPSRNLAPYLNDGTNGLNLGTCIANLPSGTMFMSVSDIQPSRIGDGIPDILVTQVADPSTSFDAYEFTDINGTRVGSSLNIVLNNIPSVGTWMADFYEATGSTVLSAGFTRTTRAIRLWAADFSAFGLNTSNIGNIAYFKINLSGTSDIAFVAYNTTTITVQQVLEMPLPNSRQAPARNGDQTSEVLELWPNPASGTLNIKHAPAVPGSAITIMNTTGEVVAKMICEPNSTANKMSLDGLPPGVYQVSMDTRTGKVLRRVVIQK